MHSGCDCCPCDPCVCPDTDESEQNFCIVEGSDREKYKYEADALKKTVWGKVRPPMDVGTSQPIVTARRAEIIRTQLIRNMPTTSTPKSNKNRCKCEPNISKINLPCK